MAALATCPERRQLEQALLGLLTDAEGGPLERHLLECAACVKTVAELKLDDTLVAAMRAQPATAERLAGARREIGEIIAGASASLFSASETSTTPPTGEEPTLGHGDHPPDEGSENHGFLAPAAGPDEVGRLGHYRVIQRLGAGGMGIVFEAEDLHLKRRVALKVMRPAMAAGAAARKRFLREAQTAATAEHDHIVSIYQVGDDRGVPFIAMQLLRGETLADRLKRAAQLPLPLEEGRGYLPGEGRGEGRLPIQNPKCAGLPLADVLRIGREIAEGLAAAHAQGLIHRDIKPGNIWLESGSDRVKLLDFGLARAAAAAAGDEHLTRAGAVMGTPAYMAPEQARGEEIDARADLFSLGCVLYHAATGLAPFARKDAMATLLAVASQQPEPAQSIAPGLPDALGDLIADLLRKDPAARPPSARAVVERLRDIERELQNLRVPGAVSLSALTGTSLCSAASHPDIEEAARRLATMRRSWGAMPALLCGAAALVLCGAVIVIKYKDGTTQTIKTEGTVADIAGITLADAPNAKAPAAVPTPPEKRSPTRMPLPTGERLAPLALVTRPAKLPGVRSWTVETAGPTSVGANHSVAIRPDGKFAAFGSVDGRIRIWELATGRLAKVLLRGDGFVSAIDWSPDGKLLAAAMLGSRVCVWDFEAGNVLADLTLQFGQLGGVAWSHDGQLLAIARNGVKCDIVRWERATGRLLEPFGLGLGPLITAIAWSPTARRLATIDAKKSRIWDGDTGELLHELDSPGHGDDDGLAWSPDGKLLACRGGSPRVEIWNAETGTLRNSFESPPTNGHFGVAWSPDGRQLAMLAGREIHVYDAATGARQSALVHPTEWGGTSLAWAKDGSRIIAGTEWGPISVWDARSLQFERSLAELPGRMLTAWSPSDRTLAAACNGKLWFWDGKGEWPAAAAGGGPFYTNNIAWSPAGDQLLGTFAWQNKLAVLSRRDEADWAARALSVPAGVAAISPDGSLVVVGLADAERKRNRLELWDLARGKLLREFDPFPSQVFQFDRMSIGIAKDYISWRPDQKEVACGALNGEVAIWNVESGELLRTLDGFKTVLPAVAYSPAGDRLAVGDRDGGGTVWICEPTGKILHALPFDFVSYSEPLHLTWSADGETLQATTNHSMRRWNAATGKKVSQIESPFRGLIGSSSASITADGRLAVAAGMDEVARIWDTETGEHLLTIVPLPGGALAGINADGHYRALTEAPDIDEQLVYVVETDAGQQTLSPKEFAEKYGWKNDPGQVGLISSEAE